MIEDGPSLTHGELAFGAGVIGARRAGATLVDPRQYAVGSIRDTFVKFPHVGALLPAMGYSEKQLADLEETIRRTPCDFVLIATPIDLRHVITIPQASLRVTYEVAERGTSELAEVIRRFVQPARASDGGVRGGAHVSQNNKLWLCRALCRGI